MSDEGLHEIQLNGKQLVFLFMAATVVAVVIFLCGVMVGRGVPTGAASAFDATGQATLDPTAAAQAVASVDTAPATTQETLTYPSLLEDPDPPAETLKSPVEPAVAAPVPVVAQPAPVAPPPVFAPPREAVTPPVAAKPPIAAVVTRPAPLPAVAPPPAVVPPRDVVPPSVAAKPPAAPVGPVTAAVDVAFAEPPGTGFVVQVAAVRQRAEADTIARRLSTRGYPVFVTTAGAYFRVRVGKYDDRREAESVAGRLEKEERVIKPWITW